jgi:hypothetical protein
LDVTFTTDRLRLQRILEVLRPGLPDGRWFLNGSAVLVLNGIRTGRPMGDLDIFLATADWFNFPLIFAEPGDQWILRTPDPDDPCSRHDPPYWLKVIEDLPVHVFFGWRVRHIADIDCNFLTANAEVTDGWPCAPLQMVADWKAQKLRAKDAIDLAAIRRYRPDIHIGEVHPV